MAKDMKMVAEGNAVVSSTDTICELHWKDYLDQNWDKLTIKGVSHILILTGVHGSKNGSVLVKSREDSEQMVKSDFAMIRFMRDRLHPEIVFVNEQCEKCAGDGKVFVQLLDISRMVEQGKNSLQENIVSAVKECDKKFGRPVSILLFAFCDTNINEVTDYLRLDTFCSRLIIERDLFDLFGRRVEMSELQAKILSWTIRDPMEKMIVLSGDFGTGKTMLMIVHLAETVKMKLAYLRSVKKLRARALMIYVPDEHVGPRLTHLHKMLERAFAGWEDCVVILPVAGNEARKGQSPYPLAHKKFSTRFDFYIEHMRHYWCHHRRKSNKALEDEATVFAMDEMPWQLIGPIDCVPTSLGEHDSLVVASKIVTGGSERAFNQTRAKSVPQLFFLNEPYRNCLPVWRLYEFLTSHTDQSYARPLLYQTREMENAPPGQKPLWIIKPNSMKVKKLVAKLKEADIISKEDDESMAVVGANSRDNHSFFQFTQEGIQIQPFAEIGGSEFGTVVALFGRPLSVAALSEIITRARNKLILVTDKEPSDECEKVVGLLNLAAEEHRGPCKKCDELVESKRTPFVGQIMVTKIEVFHE